MPEGIYTPSREEYVQRAIDLESGELAGQPDRESLVKAGMYETGDLEKGFWHNQADSVMDALNRGGKAAWGAWQKMGQSAQEYKRQHDFLNDFTRDQPAMPRPMYKDPQTGVMMQQPDFPGRKAVSDSMLIMTGMLTPTEKWSPEVYKEYAKYMEENPLDLNKADSLTDKIFNRPHEAVQAELKMHYFLNPDDRPETPDSFMDAMKNPSKMLSAIIDTGPMMAGSLMARIMKKAPLANAVIFAFEMDGAYDEAYQYLMENDVAQGKMGPEEAMKMARDHAATYAAISTAIESFQQEGLMKLGGTFKKGITAITAGKLTQELAKEGGKSVLHLTPKAVRETFFQVLDEMSQGTVQEMLQYWQLGKPLPPKEEILRKRGIEAAVSIGMMGLPLATAATVDIANGPVQRGDALVQKDVELMGQAVQHYKDKAKSEGKEGTEFITEKDYEVPSIISRYQSGLEEIIKKVFGKQVVWYQSVPNNMDAPAPADFFDGLAHPTDKGVIMMNMFGKRTLQNISFHESTHQLRRDSEQDFQQLRSIVFGFLKNTEYLSEELKNFGEQAKDWTEDDITEEIVAEVLGRLANETSFLDQLADSNPTLLAKTGRQIAKAFEAVRKGIGGRKVRRKDAERHRWIDPYITDMDELMTQILTALKNKAVREEGTAVIEEAAEEVEAAIQEAREMEVSPKPEPKTKPKQGAKPDATSGAVPKEQKALPEPSAQDLPDTQITERPERPLSKGKSAEELYVDYVEATKSKDMTQQEQERLREMVDTRSKIEKGEIEDVGLSAEEVSFEIDKYRPRAMQERVSAAQEVIKQGGGTVGVGKGKTKAQTAVERRESRRIQNLAKRKKRFSIREFFQGIKEDIKIAQLSDTAKMRRLRAIDKLNDFLIANHIYDLNDMTPDVAREFIAGLGHKYAASTINGWLSHYKVFFDVAVQRNLLGQNPFHTDFVERGKVRKRAQKSVTRAVIRKVIKSIKPKAKNRLRDIAIIEALFSSGMRAAELRGIQKGDISRQEKPGDSVEVKVFGKGSKDRVTFLSGMAVKALKKYIEQERSKVPGAQDSPYVFLSSRGNPLDNGGLLKIIKKHFGNAGTKLTTHQLRHSFAVHMLTSGMNIMDLQELLGHENLATTATYLNMPMEHLKKEHGKLKTVPDYNEAEDTLLRDKLGNVTVIKGGKKKKGGKLKPALRKLTAKEKKRASMEYSLGVLREQKMQAALKKKREYIIDYLFTNFPTLEELVPREGMMRMKGDVLMETLKKFADNIADEGYEGEVFTINRLRSEWLDLFYDYVALQDSMVKLEKGYPVRSAKPALNREAHKAWKIHMMRSTENYKKAQEKKRKAQAKKKRQLLNMLKKKEKESVRAYKEGIRGARKQLLKFIREGKDWRRKFANYVHEALPAHIRGKLLKVMAGIDDKESTLKAMGQVVKEINRLEKAEAIGRLKKWIARFKKNYGFRSKEGIKEGMKYKIATPFSDSIERLLNSILLQTPRDPIALEELLEYAEDELAEAERQLEASGLAKEQSTNPFIRFEIVPEIRRLQRLLKTKAVRQMTAQEIDEMYETLDVILGQWQHKRSEIEKARAEEFEEDKGSALDEIGSGHKQPISEAEAKKRYAKGIGRWTNRFFYKGLFGRFNYNIQTLVRIMGGMHEGAFYATLVNELFMGREREKSHVFQAMDLFQRRWKEAGLTEEDLMSYSNYGSVRGQVMPKKIEAWFKENMPDMVTERAAFVPTQDIVLKLADGQELRMTVAEALSVLMHANNEFAYGALKKAGIVTRRDVKNVRKLKDDDIEAIRRAVPEKALKLLPIFEEIMEFQSSQINEVSDHLYGYNLANVANYWHMRRFRFKGVRGKKGTVSKQTIESRSHFKERKGGEDPLYIDDAFNELVDTVRVGAEFIGLAEPMEGVRKMTNDKDIQLALMERGYAEYFKDYVDQVDSIQEHNVGLDWWEKLYGSWARNITRSVFGLNPRIAAQQYASVLLATSELGLENLKAVRGKYDPHLRHRMEKNSAMLRERFMGAITRELGDVSKTGGVMRFMTGRDQLLNIPTFMVRAFDMLAVMDVWRMSEAWAYKNYQQHRLKPGERALPLAQLLAEADSLTYEQRQELDAKRGTNTADFIDMVTQKAEATIRISQPTWDIIDRSRIGSVRNPMVKALTMFHSQREKMAQMIGIANSTYMNSLEHIRREQGLDNLKSAAATPEGLRAFRKMARVWATILVNTSIVKAWGALYGAAIMGRPDEPEKLLESIVADIPGMYYFGDTARGVIASLGKRLRGEKTYQLGSYEPPPLRVVTDAKEAAYEMGVLIIMTAGLEKAKKGEVGKQLTKTLDKTFQSINSSGGLPFQHPYDVAESQVTRRQPRKKKGKR